MWDGAVMRRSIPSLDGLRGIAVALVLLGHGLYASARERGGIFDEIVHPIAGAGVSVFFAVSGYLITRLLLAEQLANGRIALWKFYARRALRLWPALWLFLLVLVLLDSVQVLHVTLSDIFAPLFFVSDYVIVDGPTGHTWSLSVEEQFYLVWPLILISLGRARAPRWLAVGIVAAPLVRLATYALVPAWRGHETFQFHQRYDALAAGCLLALLWESPAVVRFLERRAAPLLGAGLVTVLSGFVISAALKTAAADFVLVTVQAVAYAAIVAGAVAWAPRALQWRPLVHLGLISYSLYLWHLIFILKGPSIIDRWWIGLPVASLVSEFSYRIAEQPFERLRRRLHPAPLARQPRPETNGIGAPR